MQMVHALPRVRANIGYHSVTSGETFFGRELVDHSKYLAEKLLVLVFKLLDRGQVFPGDNQDVGRSYWIDIAKGDHAVRFAYDIGVDLSRHDPAEQTIAHRRLPRVDRSSVGEPGLSRASTPSIPSARRRAAKTGTILPRLSRPSNHTRT